MSEANLEHVLCRTCRLVLNEDCGANPSERTPCPRCGSTSRTYAVTLTETVRILPTLKATGVRAGFSRTKGWFIKTLTGLVPQRSKGNAVARHERTLDRESDRYTERVTMLETGEVIHFADEPLSEHKGHGSDRPKRH